MQILIYFVIGTICGVVNVVAFAILFDTGLKIELATPATFLIAVALNYALCILILFRHNSRWNTLGEVIAYLSSVGVMGLVDYGLTIGLVIAGLPPTLGKVVSTLVGFIGNFSLRRLLVFRRESRGADINTDSF